MDGDARTICLHPDCGFETVKLAALSATWACGDLSAKRLARIFAVAQVATPDGLRSSISGTGIANFGNAAVAVVGLPASELTLARTKQSLTPLAIAAVCALLTLL